MKCPSSWLTVRKPFLSFKLLNKSFFFFFLFFPLFPPHSITTMSLLSPTTQLNVNPTHPNSQTAPLDSQNYPTPLSPSPPPISKQIELARAMSASSRSSLFALYRCQVLYEDDWLIALNKPSGIYCEAVLEAVPRLLLDKPHPIGLLKGNEASLSEQLHMVNRLDRDTSGVMLVTKLHKVASKLVKAFTDHKVRKTYIALCVGSPPKWENITVKSGHGRSKFGAWRVYSVSDVGRVLPGGSVVRNMETSFEVLSINGQGEFKELYEFKQDENVIAVEERAGLDAEEMKVEILVRAFPRSGRTHQIRLHCQYLGIPIIGDVKYQGVLEWKGKIFDSHELHAESLSFEHPVTGVPLVISTPLPSWATQALKPL